MISASDDARDYNALTGANAAPGSDQLPGRAVDYLAPRQRVTYYFDVENTPEQETDINDARPNPLRADGHADSSRAVEGHRCGKNPPCRR